MYLLFLFEFKIWYYKFMNVYIKKILICLIFFIFINISAYGSNLSQAQKLLKKAKMTSIQEESFEYINKARILLEDEYESNPADIDVQLGLSQTFQLIGDRKEAKLYVLKAYNTNPADPKLQKAMGDFFFSFQEYSTAVEYYKLALASGYLRDYETNLQTAKCFEKLGDLENAELYYKICYHVNSKSREAMNKINEYDSMKHPDNSDELENSKYKYLFKDKQPSEQEKTEAEAQELINSLSN